MDDAKLLLWIDRGEILALLLVAIGVAGEFVGAIAAKPIRKRIDEARATEMACLQKASSEATERAENLEAANLSVRGNVAALEKQAADANTKQKSVEIELEKQRTRAAEAERLLAELNERVKDRHLSMEQRSALKEFLYRVPKSSVTVGFLGMESETRSFARDLISAITDAGWSVKDNTDNFLLGSHGTGLFVGGRDLNHLPADAINLVKALRSIGLTVNGFLDDEKMAPSDFKHWVGTK